MNYNRRRTDGKIIHPFEATGLTAVKRRVRRGGRRMSSHQATRIIRCAVVLQPRYMDRQTQQSIGLPAANAKLNTIRRRSLREF